MSDREAPHRPPVGIRLRCQEVSRLISEGMERELPAAERARLRLHFVICEACRRTQQQFRFLRESVRALEQDRAGDAGGPGAKGTDPAA